LDHATTVTLQVTVVKQHNARVQRAGTSPVAHER
jgi:hypothetical protein